MVRDSESTGRAAEITQSAETAGFVSTLDGQNAPSGTEHPRRNTKEELWKGACIMSGMEMSGAMWIVNLVPLFFIVGLFLAMLSSSPKTDR